MQHRELADPGLHLLVDDAEIQDHPGFTRKVEQPLRRAAPVLCGDCPWEREAVQLWGSVLWDQEERLFKMWYYSVDMEMYKRDETGLFMCYATSADGVSWHKPELGILPCNGSAANNIVYPTPGTPKEFGIDPWGILKDPEAQDPARRFRMGFYQQRPAPGLPKAERGDVAGQIALFRAIADHHGMYSAHSPDGVHWQLDEALRVPRAGDAGALVWDPLGRRYLTTSRRYDTLMDHFALQWKQYRRVIALAHSADFAHWSPLRTVLKPDDFYAPRDQMYMMTPFAYGNQYLGFLGMYHTDMELGETQLASARDLDHWQRVARREVFLPVGAPGTWDSAWATCAASPPILMDDTLYIWYSGRPQAHGTQGMFRSAIGLATLRRDGFVSLRCGMRGGELMTEPILVSGPRLLLNAVCLFGQIRARVICGDEAPSEFSLEECKGLARGDQTGFELTWGHEGRNLAPLVGRQVRLHFQAENATSLYTYRFCRLEQ